VRPAGRPGWRSQLILLAALVVGGIVVALAWRVLDPYTAKLGEDNETAATVDGTLVLLGLVAGLLTAAFVLIRPGTAPATRTITAILGSVLGAVISWQVGDQVGTPALRATGAAFVWPLATAVFLFFGALLPVTSRRLLFPEPQFRPVQPPVPPAAPAGPLT
jgi:hypothetical protein